MTEAFEIVCRFVPKYGYIGILYRDSREVYRTGGFHHEIDSAYEACKEMAEKLWGDLP